MNKHSPTPWGVTGWNIRTSEPEVGESPIAIGPFAPGVSDASVPPASVTANLEFIVRAVNSHADLLGALKRYQAQHDRSSTAGRCDCVDCGTARYITERAKE